MRLTEGYASYDVWDISKINQASFTGDECPPDKTLMEMLSISDVFLMKAEERDGAKPGTVLGFAIVQSAGAPYLWSLAVDPAFRERGIASSLLSYIATKYQLAGEKQIRLHVHQDNLAQKLYFDNGYRVSGTSTDFYATGIGVVMTKKL